jgi:hemolysin activation/secretion protein
VIRGGGAYAFGDYPFFEAASLGGGETLRGFPSWRFSGDASLFGSAELVAPVARLPLLMNWKVSGHAFMDVGRVFLDGEQSRIWHSAPGVAVTLSALDYHASVGWAHGNTGRFYLSIGVPPGHPRAN